jgi:ornithine carbamoyltransferase
VAWVGDGNNMANTWLQAAALLGFTVHVARRAATRWTRNWPVGTQVAQGWKTFSDPLEACAAPTW